MGVEVFYPNNDDPRKERPERPIESIIDDVEFYLLENTKDGETVFTLEQIATDQGIENFRDEVAGNKRLQESLEKFIDLNEMEAFKFYNNRADANFLALLFSEVQKSDEKP
jgi:hypothetical protein